MKLTYLELVHPIAVPGSTGPGSLIGRRSDSIDVEREGLTADWDETGGVLALGAKSDPSSVTMVPLANVRCFRMVDEPPVNVQQKNSKK